MNKLEKIMRGFDPWSLQGLPKDAQINLRLSKKEKESIEAVAKESGLGVSEYLLTLHRFVVNKIRSGA